MFPPPPFDFPPLLLSLLRLGKRGKSEIFLKNQIFRKKTYFLKNHIFRKMIFSEKSHFQKNHTFRKYNFSRIVSARQDQRAFSVGFLHSMRGYSSFRGYSAKIRIWTMQDQCEGIPVLESISRTPFCNLLC